MSKGAVTQFTSSPKPIDTSVVLSDIGQYAEFFEILISIDRRLRKEKQNVEPTRD